MNIFEAINQSGVLDGIEESGHYPKMALDGAAKYDTLYHCTCIDNFLSIIEHKEFRQSLLKNVNDEDEFNRVFNSFYDDKIFISSFTYNKKVDTDHWKEYGKYDNGVMFSIKKQWFTNNIYGIVKGEDDSLKTIHIYKNDEGISNARNIRISSFEFLKVIYDNNLFIKIKGENNHGFILLNPQASAIIKKECGISKKTDKEKNWSVENEVRLRTILCPYGGSDIKTNVDYLVIKLFENCFDNFEMSFSPGCSKDKIKATKKKIKDILPNSDVTYLE